MSIKIRPYVKKVSHAPGCTKKRCGSKCRKEIDGFEYDIRFVFPNGAKVRERKQVPLDTCTKSKAKEWAESRERELWAEGPPTELSPGWRLTVADLAVEWKDYRKGRDLEPSLHSHYDVHIAPRFGELKLAEVNDKHVDEFLQYLRTTKSARAGDCLANGSIRRIFYTLHNLFRRAVARGYLDKNPVNPEAVELPMNTDKDLEWRDTARFNAAEVALLIGSPKLPLVRRIAHALAFLTGMRPGEAAAMRWCDYDACAKPLGKMTVNRSFSSRMRKVKSTKTGRARYVPVHPLLAAMLSEWREHGWREWMGCSPDDGDLIIPSRRGKHRQSTSTLRQFHADLKLLGLRKRRQYDSRRTFISMALDAGANHVHTMYMTHAPPQQEFWKYVTSDWESLCAVVMCLRIPVDAPSDDGHAGITEVAA